jgi:hypothetical protein
MKGHRPLGIGMVPGYIFRSDTREDLVSTEQTVVFQAASRSDMGSLTFQ